MLPEILKLDQQPQSVKDEVISTLFEYSPVLVEKIGPLLDKQWQSYSDLIESIRQTFLLLLESSVHDTAAVDNIISSHPRLGEKKNLSAHSSKEQAKISDFMDYNQKYEDKFGFKLIIFVNGRGEKELIEIAKERLENSPLEERKNALNAMCDIALTRSK